MQFFITVDKKCRPWRHANHSVTPSLRHPSTYSGKGFTLYEMLIYLALFMMLSVLIVGLVMQLLTAGMRTARTREVVSAVSGVYDALFYEARFANEVYEPTSVFGDDASQVSLKTSLGVPAGEPFSFVDFYLDNGRVFMKREAAAPKALSSERVLVDRFKIIRRNPLTTSESLQIAVGARHRFARDDQEQFSATSSITLRRY
ncbi:MAG: hypothetical protein Q8Q39_00050 [bacterium]|nr:hypothetical protein [bacterium]